MQGDRTTFSVEFLQGLFDALTTPVCVVDRTDRILLTNRAWQHVANQHNGDDLCRHNYLQLCAASSDDGCASAGLFRSGLLAVLNHEIPEYLQEYSCHSPTEERWFVCRITRFDHQGQTLAVISHQDITSKILAERASTQSETLFKAIFDQALTGMVQNAVDGTFLRVNPAFCTITGYQEQELLGMNLMDLTLPEDLLDVVNQAHHLLEEEYKQGYTLEKRYRHKNGTIVWVNLQVSLVRNPDRSPSYFVAVIEDITTRKQAEARAQELHLQLERRLHLLTQPDTENASLTFADLFDLAAIQRLQDSMAEALGVSCIITDLEGKPITGPSNFCTLCKDIIRRNGEGQRRCRASNASFGVPEPGRSFVAQCHSAGLLDGGTSIFIGNRRIANWVVGQVIDEEIDPEQILAYTDQIGADREQFRLALQEIPRMDKGHFRTICHFVAQVAEQLSTIALHNHQQSRDIELRIQYEQQLEQANYHYRQILQDAPVMIWRADTNGTTTWLTWANKTWLQFTGNSLAKELQQSWHNPVHPDDRNGYAAVWEHALTTYSPFSMEYRYQNAAGDYRWITNIGHPYTSASGETAGFIGYCFDMTERHRMEDELRRSEEQLRTLIETTADGFIAVNPWTLRNLMVNQSICTMLGYSRAELMELGIMDCICPEHQELGRLQSAQIPITDHRSYDIDLLTKDKRRLPVHFSASTLRDETGTPILSFAFIHDITDRKRYESELLLARHAAEAASLAKSNFLSSMSHELRTPLNSIIGFSELIHDGLTGPVTEQQHEYLANVLMSARHLLQIISEILDLSRIEAGKLKLELQPFSLDELLRQLQAMFVEQAVRRVINLELIPRHPPGLSLTGDEVKLRQVVINLLSNALKFTDPGGTVTVITRLVADQHPAVCMIEVNDTGIGIREEDLPKLFQEFSQIQPTMTRNRDGTGLGLALSKRLVELHGGRIEVSSTYGVGSSFRVILPMVPQMEGCSATFDEA